MGWKSKEKGLINMTPQPLKLIILLGLLVMFVGIITVSYAEIQANEITVTGYPSAINQLQYKQYTTTWENHCPLCGHNNTLIENPKRVYENELTCNHCDADFCAVTGKDKSYNVRAVLNKA